MQTDKFVLINDLRVKYCKPCTTANSCVGCLVDVMEEALRASQQSVHRTPEQLDRLHENLDEIIEVGAGGE